MAREERSKRVEVEKSRSIKGIYMEMIILIDHGIYIGKDNGGIAAFAELPDSTMTLESHLTP